MLCIYLFIFVFIIVYPFRLILRNWIKASLASTWYTMTYPWTNTANDDSSEHKTTSAPSIINGTDENRCMMENTLKCSQHKRSEQLKWRAAGVATVKTSNGAWSSPQCEDAGMQYKSVEVIEGLLFIARLESYLYPFTYALGTPIPTNKTPHTYISQMQCWWNSRHYNWQQRNRYTNVHTQTTGQSQCYTLPWVSRSKALSQLPPALVYAWWIELSVKPIHLYCSTFPR